MEFMIENNFICFKIEDNMLDCIRILMDGGTAGIERMLNII